MVKSIDLEVEKEVQELNYLACSRLLVSAFASLSTRPVIVRELHHV